jgi:phage terminase large subunit GpA-like protein
MTFHPYNPLRGIALDVVTSTVDWCAENVYLSPRIPTARPGQWQPGNVAALCRPGGPLESLDDPAVETVVVTKGSQTALTTTAYCWLAKTIANDPGSALIVMNSTQDARDKSAETWRPMWEDSPRLKAYLPACRRKDWTKLYQLLNRAPVYWVGANSAGRLGAKPIRRLILDEVDKYPMKFGGDKAHREAGAAALAEQRTKTFRQSGLAKILKFSTPTTDTGEIWTAYEQGDQRKLYVRCPRCKAEQVMVWAAFKIDMDRAKQHPAAAVAAAHYECPHCRKPWTDAQRWEAIDGGTWKATAQASDPRCRSFQLPSWCSKLVTVQYLAAQWIKAQGSTSALQDFINSECGEPFRHYDTQIRDTLFAELEGEYDEGATFADAPAYRAQYGTDDRFVFGGVDVQKGYLVAVFRQFAQGGDSGLVWSGDVANLEALDELATRYDAKFVLVDQRYRQREIQEWAHTHSGYIPTQGVTTRARSLYTVNSLDLDEGKSSRTGQRVIEVLGYDSDQLKDLLANQIQRGQGARRWLVPRGYAVNAKYCQQMSAERCVNGRWINPQQRANHFWDAEALCLLAAIRFGVWGAITKGAENGGDNKNADS